MTKMCHSRYHPHLWQCLLIAVHGIIYQISNSAATISTRYHDTNVAETHRHFHRLRFFRRPTGIQLTAAQMPHTELTRTSYAFCTGPDSREADNSSSRDAQRIYGIPRLCSSETKLTRHESTQSMSKNDQIQGGNGRAHRSSRTGTPATVTRY